MEDLSKKYDERTLRLIIQTLIESGVEYDDEFDDSMCDEIEDALKYIGIEPKNWEDYTFYFQLLRINPNYKNESVNVPELGKYEVDTDVILYESARETWRKNVFSYFDSRDLIEQQVINNYDSSYWEGDMIDREVFDSSIEREEISNVERIEYRYKK